MLAEARWYFGLHEDLRLHEGADPAAGRDPATG